MDYSVALAVDSAQIAVHRATRQQTVVCVRRPWCSFFGATFCLVFTFAASGPALHLMRPAPIVRYQPGRAGGAAASPAPAQDGASRVEVQSTAHPPAQDSAEPQLSAHDRQPCLVSKWSAFWKVQGGERFFVEHPTDQCKARAKELDVSISALERFPKAHGGAGGYLLGAESRAACTLPICFPAVRSATATAAVEPRLGTTAAPARGATASENNARAKERTQQRAESIAKEPARAASEHHDPGGMRRVPERSPLIQAMIEAGFSREQAETALKAVGATTTADVAGAISWQLKQGAERNRAEAARARAARSFPHLDLDGYALKWGSEHRTATVEECGQRCLELKPAPPAHYAVRLDSNAVLSSQPRQPTVARPLAVQRLRLLPASQVLRPGRAAARRHDRTMCARSRPRPRSAPHDVCCSWSAPVRRLAEAPGRAAAPAS